jgi:hypothetical protein
MLASPLRPTASGSSSWRRREALQLKCKPGSFLAMRHTKQFAMSTKKRNYRVNFQTEILKINGCEGVIALFSPLLNCA